ncbi:MAG: hypothetical protein M3P13_09075 [Acidobacteriota bacterium]|nr:hypothetical protein [Acidobacteriota bacterium]
MTEPILELADATVVSDAQRLSAVFAHPVVVEAADGYYYARPESASH